jgi:MFS family permease
MGWFLSGTLVGPAFGPFVGGIIVTFKSWRVIFYLQTALAGIAVVGAYFFLPETAHNRKVDELVGLTVKAKAKFLGGMLNPWRVLRLYRYPNLVVVSVASSALVSVFLLSLRWFGCPVLSISHSLSRSRRLFFFYTYQFSSMTKANSKSL